MKQWIELWASIGTQVHAQSDATSGPRSSCNAGMVHKRPADAAEAQTSVCFGAVTGSNHF